MNSRSSERPSNPKWEHVFDISPSSGEHWDWVTQHGNMLADKAIERLGTVDSAYHQEFRTHVTSAIERAIQVMRKDDDGQPIRRADVTKSATITFKMVDPSTPISRGDLRYGHGALTELVRSGRDLTPAIVVAGNMYMADGHHRQRAYKDAGRNMPVVHVEIDDNPPEKYVGKVRLRLR